MRLEIGEYPVEQVEFDSETSYSDGVLKIDKEELRRLVLEDSSFEDVVVRLARPGDNLRVINVVDVIEPRTRVPSSAPNFPGLLALPGTVGAGRTNRLSGIAVTEVAAPLPGEQIYWREALFDMMDPGAQFSPFSNLMNVVLVLRPSATVIQAANDRSVTDVFGGNPTAREFNRSIRVAGLRVAVYLARAAESEAPSSVEKWEMEEAPKDLPRVAYLYQLQSPYVYGEIAPRGGSIGGSGHLPTLIHPNEIFDGALVNSYNNAACLREPTYLMQNHALIRQLYGRHGKDLDFRGVIIYTSGDNPSAKERIASYAAKLVELIGAQGAILNYMGAGHHEVDVMMTCQKLEQQGVRTSLILMEMAENPRDSGFVHFVPEADAIVSTGNYEEQTELPKAESVVGGAHLLESGDDSSGELKVKIRHILGSTEQFGSGTLTGKEY
jgi:sarcosine reductase